MKKKLMVLLSLIMVFAMLLTACGQKPAETAASTDSKQPAEAEKKEPEAEKTDSEKAEPALTDGGKGTIEAIKKKGKLVVGTSADYPPYEFHMLIDGKDEIVGFDISLAKHIAEKMGVKLEIADMAFESLLIGLETGKFDMVIAAMNPDPKRNATFSEIYYSATHGVLTTKEKLEQFNTKEDLPGKKLGVQIGTVQEGIGEKIEGAEIKALPLITNLILELTTGKIDGIIMEIPVAESYAKVNQDLIVVPTIEWGDAAQGSAVAMRKGNEELKAEVDKILEEVLGGNLMDQWLVEANELNEKVER